MDVISNRCAWTVMIRNLKNPLFYVRLGRFPFFFSFYSILILTALPKWLGNLKDVISWCVHCRELLVLQVGEWRRYRSGKRKLQTNVWLTHSRTSLLCVWNYVGRFSLPAQMYYFKYCALPPTSLFSLPSKSSSIPLAAPFYYTGPVISKIFNYFVNACNAISVKLLIIINKVNKSSRRKRRKLKAIKKKKFLFLKDQIKWFLFDLNPFERKLLFR